MAKYLWFIVDTATGVVKGTNDTDAVLEYIDLDSYVVIHNEGVYYMGSNQENEIKQLSLEDLFEDEDNESDDLEDEEVEDFNPNDDPSYGIGN